MKDPRLTGELICDIMLQNARLHISDSIVHLFETKSFLQLCLFYI